MIDVKVGLLFDDDRFPVDVEECRCQPEVTWYKARDLESFKHRIDNMYERRGYFFDQICFDWFLGKENGHTGMDGLLYLIEHFKIPRPYKFPLCTFHSSDHRKMWEMRELYGNIPYHGNDITDKILPIA